MRSLYFTPAFRTSATGPSNARHAGQQVLSPERTAVKQGD